MPKRSKAGMLLTSCLHLRSSAAAAPLPYVQRSITIRTVVCTLPFDARVTNLTTSEGAFAHVGTQLFTLIDTRVWWVIANYRETQLRNIHPGTKADVYLMPQADRRFNGVVDSIGYGVAPDPAIIGILAPGLPDAQRHAQLGSPCFTLSGANSHHGSRAGSASCGRKRRCGCTPGHCRWRTGSGCVRPMTGAAAMPKSDAGRQSAYRWFVDFLLTELEPFPGRGFTVARMTLTATLVMLWIMVFRIPGAALGAYYTLLFSRDNTAATLTSCIRAVCAVGVSLVYVIVTVRLFTGDPFLHFLWVAGTLFLIFFLLSSLTEYLAGTAFGFLAVTSITGWDFPANTDLLYANTLWTALAVVVSALVTTAVEIVARSIHPYDELTDRLLARLWVMEHVLRCLVQSRSIGEDLNRRLSQYAMVGTGALRQLILRSRESTDYKAQISGAVALIGRLIDLTASVCTSKTALRDEETSILDEAANQLEQIRSLLAQRNLRAIAQLPSHFDFADSRSVVVDIATTVSRIPQVFAGMRSLHEYQPSDIDAGQRRPLFKETRSEIRLTSSLH